MIDQAIVNYAIYEDSREFLGTVDATLPNLNWLTTTISGAGIAGNVDAVMPHLDAMNLSLSFRTATKESYSLAEHRRHNIELRASRQDEDPVSGELLQTPVKHVMVVIPKTMTAGRLAPASASDASGEYAVRYWACYIDGEQVLELDPLNYILKVNGVDYGAPVRRALGK